MGMAVGGIIGGAQGLKYAKTNGLDPFSGKLIPKEGSTVVRHHTSPQAMASIKNSQEITPSRDSGYGFKGTDFEGSPNFNGNQNFDNYQNGAFIEMRLSNDILIPYQSPHPAYSNYFRVNSGGGNFVINPGNQAQYYINLKFW
ncbi:hypothetical protein [Gelidibacter salicanalis]|uniref:Uncharacterized protein n=1 Tax=Gelidibacter salicanalis TaxID=291193 RepID=A0A934KUH1_9FLAO|nr:hypothetical protein [Gelidibacter salicanalis]MBJ7880433.1 hypothetical protein [Gelidibacter salicanalis]